MPSVNVNWTCPKCGHVNAMECTDDDQFDRVQRFVPILPFRGDSSSVCDGCKKTCDLLYDVPPDGSRTPEIIVTCVRDERSMLIDQMLARHDSP